MRILMTTRFYLNGQTTHILDLSRQLVLSGHEVFLVLSQLDHPGYIKWLQNNKIPFSRTEDITKLAPYLRKLNFDVIHTHSAHTLGQSLEVGQLLHIPVVATCHYLDFEPLELLKQAQAVIAISEEMKQKLKLQNVPVMVVENGVPIPHLYKHEKKTVAREAVFLARVTEKKRPGFEQMAQYLLDEGWTVRSVGNWRYPGVRSRGWTINVYSQLHTADLVIGTGRAVREGMAAGCAVMVLGEHFDGLVTPKSVENLRKTNFSGRTSYRVADRQVIKDVLDEVNRDALARLQQFGRQYAKEHFSIENMVNELTAIYDRVRFERKNDG